MADIERLNRYTLFVDDDGESDQSPHYNNSLKRSQTSQTSPTHEPTKKGRLKWDDTSKAITAPLRLPLPIKNAQNNKSLFRNVLVPVVSGSPWDRYEKTYARDLAGKVAMAVKLPARKEQFVVRSLSGSDVNKKLLNIRQFHHDNLVKTHEIFAYNDDFYLVSEIMSISLKHICRCPNDPNERQLAVIAKQILNGICFLTDEKLAHNALTPSNILINGAGDVKIANLEYCQTDNKCGRKNAESLGRVLSMVMDKDDRKSNVLGLARLGIWEKRSRLAVDFLPMTTTSTPNTLKENEFITMKCSKDELKWFVPYVQGSAKMD